MARSGRPKSFRLRNLVSFSLLLAAKAFSKLFYRAELTWIGGEPETGWRGVRVAAFLNHTSLFEWLFAAAAPNSFLWRIATQTVLPSADKKPGASAETS